MEPFWLSLFSVQRNFSFIVDIHTKQNINTESWSQNHDHRIMHNMAISGNVNKWVYKSDWYDIAIIRLAELAMKNGLCRTKRSLMSWVPACPSFFWYDNCYTTEVSYQKKDGCGPARTSFFWYDNDSGHQGPFRIMQPKWLHSWEGSDGSHNDKVFTITP